MYIQVNETTLYMKAYIVIVMSVISWICVCTAILLTASNTNGGP